MKQIRFSLILLFLCQVLNLSADNVLNYEIEGAGTGTQGTYLVKVYVVSKKNKPNINLIKKCAVHGVLFRGLTNGRVKLRPIAGGPMTEQQHKEYFEQFFMDEGYYRNFVTMVSDQYEIVKTKKKEYRIGVTITVFTEQLRKHLEQDNIITGISSFF